MGIGRRDPRVLPGAALARLRPRLRRGKGQDHRLVARGLARTFLGSAQKRRYFFSGEVIAEARFAGHANNLPPTPSALSPRRLVRSSVRRTQQSPLSGSRRVPFCMQLFRETRNPTRKRLPVLPMSRLVGRHGKRVRHGALVGG